MGYIGPGPADQISEITDISETAQAFLLKGRKNFLINTLLRISQRGDFSSSTALTFGDTGTFKLDRWKIEIQSSSTLQNLATNQPGSLADSKSLRFTNTSATTDPLSFQQPIENFADLKGKQVVISGYIKTNNANARLGIRDGVANPFSSPAPIVDGSTWNFVTVTTTLSSSITQGIFKVGILGPDGASSTSMGAGDFFEMTGCQVEVAPTPTDLDYVSAALELADCQRYYWRIERTAGDENRSICIGRVNSSGVGAGVLNFPVPMRVAPSMSASSNAVATDDSANSIITSPTFTHIGNSSTRMQTVSGFIIGRAVLMQFVGANDFIEADAEL